MPSKKTSNKAVSKKKVAKKQTTTKKISKRRATAKKKVAFVLDDIDIMDHFRITRTLYTALENEYGNSDIMLVKVFLCTCGPKKKNVKSYMLSYPKPVDYNNRKLHVEATDNVTQKDIDKLRNILINAREDDE